MQSIIKQNPYRSTVN